MTSREQYTPGPASGAQVQKKEGEQWTLVLVRQLRHAPEKVWQALTDPAQLREWAPFNADGNMGTTGTSIKLTTIGAPQLHVVDTKIIRAEEPKLLEYNWGGGDIRWELEPLGSGTRLTLWANINRHWVALGASGWHVCLDVLDHLLGGTPLGRIVAGDALKVPGWEALVGQYAQQFGVEPPKWFGHGTTKDRNAPSDADSR